MSGVLRNVFESPFSAMPDFIEGSVMNVMKKLFRENVYRRDEVDE